jgi:outer membrane protein TolC
LRQLVGRDIRPVAGTLLESPIEAGIDETVDNSPYAREQAAAVAEIESQRKVLDRAYYPRFNLQGSSYARGTGAHPDGSTSGGVSGLGPNIHNWALGMTVTFPAFDLPSLRVRKEIIEHRRLAETARYDEILVELRARLQKARDQAQSASRVAALIPRQLEAARAAEQQARARYQAGLGTLIEVAEAQRLLTQTEIDHALAHLNVWRSLLSAATARGDLAPFLKQVK